MRTPIERLDYDDLQAIVARARMERSVAVGDAIAGMLALVFNGLTRAANAIRSTASGSDLGRREHDSPILEASGHR